MIPGNTLILTCPYCGEEKEVMSIVSGNTFGARLWSDNKQIARMLPEISYVQKCPNCGKYYIMSRLKKTRYSEDRTSFEQGLLTFPEMKEAFVQLSKEGFINKKEESQVRMMLHHAYNDYYYRDSREKEVDKNDKILFRESALWLIKHHITDNVMKAEFYREIGEMEQARRTLDAAVINNDFVRGIADTIREKLDANECRVFEINMRE